MNETRNRTNMRVWTHLTTAVLLCGGLVSCDRVPEQRSAEHLSLDWSVYIGRVTAARLEEELPLYLANLASTIIPSPTDLIGVPVGATRSVPLCAFHLF